MTSPSIEIGGRQIGATHPCFIIAEAGVNHNGDLDLATRLIDEARLAGADAIKFQTFKAERLATSSAPKAPYQWETTDREESQLEMLKRLELSELGQRGLQRHAADRGILWLSTPFEESSADFLDELGVPAFKIPSGELTNLPLLRHVAHKGRLMIVSTGMATLDEVAAAVEAIRAAGGGPIVLLHCVSEYPADPAKANLRAMQTMADTFGVPVGYSDHTPGIEVALAAVALGACIVEKHFTIDRNFPGPDHRASLEPSEFAALVRGIRLVESSLGHGRKEPTPGEAETAAAARKSLIAAKTIRQGTVLTKDFITIRRPGTGLPPAAEASVLGRIVLRDVPAGHVLTWDLFENEPAASSRQQEASWRIS